MTSYDAEITYDTYADDDAQGDGLPRIQSRHGDPAANSAFRFFLAQENTFDGFEPSEPWRAHTEYFKATNTRVPGWACEALPMMIICARSQVYAKGPDGKRTSWVASWPKDAPKNSHGMHVDVLLYAKGLELLGPVVWSTNGSTTSFAIIGQKGTRQPEGGILSRIRDEVLSTADRLSAKVKTRAKAKAYWAFWATIAGAVDAKGAPVYTQPIAGGSVVTIPVPVLPAVLDGKWLAGVYVGADLDAYGRQLRAEYETWRTETRTDTPTPATNGNGRNVPQDVSDDVEF